MTGKHIPAREMMEKLISFDTTSSLSNMELISFVRDYLAGWGIESLLVPNEDGSKANLYATIGAQDEGGIVLSGHTDVVPVEGQAWSSNPFALVERGGKLYGRGACDMKGFIAIALSRVPDMVAANPKTPVHFAFSYDEEVGCTGVKSLIDHMKEHLPKPRAVIVGEPSDMTVVNAHKGGYNFVTEVTGLESHSSLAHRGVNAIMYAGEIIGEINRISVEYRARIDKSGRYEPPYSTVQVGVIKGGTALNITPLHCRIDWEMRALPGDDAEEVLARINAFSEKLIPDMHAVSTETGIENRIALAVPALVPEDGSPAETLVMALARQNETYAVSYQTEAGHFQKIDIPTVICGPGNIAQAHKPDEYVSLEQVSACEAFMDRLVAHVAAD
ncbi:MAG: acetylornithine deacetylase [Hyphomicrobiales bacterium]